MYVAVTRARSRLLVYEGSEEAAGVLLDFLQLCSAAGELVQVQPVSGDVLRSLQQEGSPAAARRQWVQTGTALFHEGRFERAEVSTSGEAPLMSRLV